MADLPVLSSEERRLAVAAGKTDTGRRRKHNEDRILVVPELGLFAVADGMGGHQAGDVASRIAATTLEDYYRAAERDEASPADHDAASAAGRHLVEAVLRCNRAVYAESGRSTSDGGMGSTIVALHLSADEDALHVVHVGDSRCYRIREGAIEQLTEDHSAINEALRRNPKLSKEILERLPSNVVTRALGMKDDVKPDLRTEPLQPGDVYLLCSDGLCGLVSDDDILFAILEAESLENACELLVTLANDAGGRDNISAVLVRLEDGAGEHLSHPVPLRAAPPPVVEAEVEAESSVELAVAERESLPVPLVPEAPPVPAGGPSALASVSEASPADAEEAPHVAADEVTVDGELEALLTEEASIATEEEARMAAQAAEPIELRRVVPEARVSDPADVEVVALDEDDDLLDDAVLELGRPKLPPPVRAAAAPPVDPLAVIVGLPIVSVGEPAPVSAKGRSSARQPCPGCGHEPLPIERFCGMCGTSLVGPKRPPVDPSAPRCHECGAARLPGTRFCVECGVRFSRRRLN